MICDAYMFLQQQRSVFRFRAQHHNAGLCFVLQFGTKQNKQHVLYSDAVLGYKEGPCIQTLRRTGRAMSDSCDAFGRVANRLAAWAATLAMEPLLASAADVGERAIGEDAPALHVDADVDADVAADVAVVVAYIALFTLFKTSRGGRPAANPRTPTLPALVRESCIC